LKKQKDLRMGEAGLPISSSADRHTLLVEGMIAGPATGQPAVLASPIPENEAPVLRAAGAPSGVTRILDQKCTTVSQLWD
jgi:hypothetical protein